MLHTNIEADTKYVIYVIPKAIFFTPPSLPYPLLPLAAVITNFVIRNTYMDQISFSTLSYLPTQYWYHTFVLPAFFLIWKIVPFGCLSLDNGTGHLSFVNSGPWYR